MQRVDPPPLKIAIIGGGIAGATLWLALEGLAGVEMHVYDGARELREIGASIALQPCGLRILEKLGVGSEVEAVAYRGPNPASMIYRNYRTAEIIAAPPPTRLSEPRHRTARFFRPHLHRILTSRIPSNHLQLGKKLASIHDTPGEPIVLNFQDGSTAECDLLVGCDGIKSAVRRHYLPGYKLDVGRVFTLRSSFPASRLAEMADFLIDPAHWWGPDRAFFTSPLAKGIFSFVAFVPDAELRAGSGEKTYVDAKWDEAGSVTALRTMYKDWHPIIRRVCDAADEVRCYPDYHGPPLERMDLPSGRAVLLGDAGHPHGGAFAVGDSLAIEDAYALALCIRRSVASPSTLPLSAALCLVSNIRVGHVNKVIAAAHSVRQAKDRRSEQGIQLTEDEIRKAVLERDETEWIGENDVERDFERLVAKLVEERPEEEARAKLP